MQGHRPEMQPVPMIAAGVSVNGLTFTPYAIFGQNIGASGPPPAPAPSQPQPQSQPNGVVEGPSSSPRRPPEGVPPPPWQATTGIAPSQTHINPPPPPPNQEHMIHRPPPHWEGYGHNGHPSGPIPGPSTGETYEYRFREDANGGGQWVPAHSYYDPGVRAGTSP